MFPMAKGSDTAEHLCARLSLPGRIYLQVRLLLVIAVLQGVATPGINIVGMTMLLQFVVSFGFILVVNAPQNMVAYGTETFEARDFVRTGLVLTVIAFALVMLLGATY